jgi:hypothetical protein
MHFDFELLPSQEFADMVQDAIIKAMLDGGRPATVYLNPADLDRFRGDIARRLGPVIERLDGETGELRYMGCEVRAIDPGEVVVV